MFAFSNINKQKEDAASLLGISAESSDVDIRKAYRKKALQYHPDKNINNKEAAEEMFKKITKAYDVLLKDDIDIPNIFTHKSYEEQLDIDADDIFNIFNQFSMPTENVFVFGPESFNPKKKKLTYKVKINITDIWLNKIKKLPVNEVGLINLPLYYEKITFESKEYNIDVKIVDKNTEIFKRRNQYDMEIIHPIQLTDLYRNHNFKITLPDESTKNIHWKKNYIDNIKDTIPKEFFLYNLGMPINNNDRGKLYIKFKIIFPNDLPKDIKEDEKEGENVENIEWVMEDNSNKKSRSKVFNLNNYLL